MSEFVRIFDYGFNGLVVSDVESFGDDGGYLAYDFPDPLAYGQFHRVLTDILEQPSDCLISGKPSGSGEYVVLKESNGGMSNLCGEVAGLAFAEAEILLAILENHLDRPAHRIKFIRLVEVKGGVCCKYAAPWGVFATPHIKQTHCHILNERVHDNIMAAVPTAILHPLGLGGTFADDCSGRKFLSFFAEGESHAFFSHFNHAEIMAFDSSGLYEAYDVFACEPTVSQKIIKSISVFDGPAYHIFEQLYFALGIVLHAFGSWTFLVAFFLKPAVQLCLRHGMVAILARLSDKFKINHHLTLSVAYGKHQRLESEYHLMCDVAKNATNLLSMNTTLGIVGVIHNKTDWMVGMISADSDLAPKLPGDMVHDFAPVETIVVDESIENILRCAA